MIGSGQSISFASNLWFTCLLRVLLPEYGQIGQGVRQLLSRHRGIGEHACAGMALAYGIEPGFVGGQSKPLPIPEIRWWRIELFDERSSVGRELRPLAPVPIDAMAVVADTLPVKDLLAPRGIALSCRALARQPGTSPDMHVTYVRELDRQQTPEHEANKGESPQSPTRRIRHHITLPIDSRQCRPTLAL